MCQNHPSSDGDIRPGAPLTRRGMLRLSALGGAAALGGTLLGPREADAMPWRRDPITTPQQALTALMEGNCCFARGHATAPRRSLDRVREIAPRQTPFASILGCADSRVPAELLFDQGFGDLFVCRSAGNTAASELIGSLEYGAIVLGSKLVMVLGHTDCGAVKAAIGNDTVPGQISTLYPALNAAVAQAGGNAERAIELNVREQVRILSTASTVLAPMVRDGRIWVLGAVYNLNDGVVRVLSPHPGELPPCLATCPEPRP